MNGTSHLHISDILFAPEWDCDKTLMFMAGWVPQAFKITLGYLAMVYFGVKFMKSRPPVDNKAMDLTLALWNFTFSLFSAVAAYKLLPELFKTISNHGFVGSYCYLCDYYTNPNTGYWGWMFVMSKAPELGDTLFLILRKRPVIFLHWYHHALTFLYAQITYSEKQAWCRWSLALNLAVHTVMYFYFGIQAMKIKTPRYVAKFITTIQLVQFIISCYIFVQIVHIKTTDSTPNCSASWNVLSIGALMYLSYLYLFGQFFYNAYIAKSKTAKKID